MNLGRKNYEVYKGDKIAKFLVIRIASEEGILVENQDTTERDPKGFGSSDIELIKQVRTGANLLLSHPTKKCAR